MEGVHFSLQKTCSNDRQKIFFGDLAYPRITLEKWPVKQKLVLQVLIFTLSSISTKGSAMVDGTVISCGGNTKMQNVHA